jgi:methylmalonyl-CoA mutase C-terminal domain/subunit
MVNTERKIRVLIGKPGLDPHDRGPKILAKALREAGFEVIYLGLRQTPENVVNAAIQEDVDFILLSFHCGSHISFTRDLMKLLREKDIRDISVLCGGVIPNRDVPYLKEIGVKEIFLPMSPVSNVIEFIKENVYNEGRDI